MLDFIFGFERYNDKEVTWILNLNHLLMVIFFLVLITVCYLILPSKNKNAILMTKISMAILIVVLELGRVYWKIARHKALSTLDNPMEGFDYFRVISFSVCAVNVWITVVVLIVSIFIANNNKTLVVLKNMLFGAASVGGILSFLAPVHLSPDRHVLHWINMQTILQHAMLVIVPIFLIKSGQIKPRIKNLWMPAFGFISVGTFIVFISHLSGKNFATVLGVGVDLEKIFPFPLHLAIFPLLAFIITICLYLPFEIKYRKENKEAYSVEVSLRNIKKTSITKEEKLYTYLPYATCIVLFLSTLLLPILLGSPFRIPQTSNDDGYRALRSWTSSLVLIPLFMQVIVMYYSYHKKQNLLNEDN